MHATPCDGLRQVFNNEFVGTCELCPAGHFRWWPSCMCYECSYLYTLQGERFYAGTCVPTSEYLTFEYCRDLCGVGEYESHGCGSPDINKDRTCTACPTGKYRNDINTQAGCVDCTPCAWGFYRSAPCGPIQNTVAARECTECPTNQYMPWQTTTCVACATCGLDSRVTVQCSRTTQRECQKCEDGSRSVEVNSFCTMCIDGYYPPGGYANGVRQGQCAPCSGSAGGAPEGASCGAGFWVECTGGTRVCRTCEGHTHLVGVTGVTNSVLCPLGHGVPGACTGRSNANAACTPCGAGTERLSTTAMLNGNVQVCAQCRTGRNKPAAGTGECVVCTNKPANSEYTAWGTAAATTASCPWCAGLFLCLLWSRAD